MAFGTINLDEPAVADKLLDTLEMSNGSDTVEREIVALGGAAHAEVAAVMNSAPSNEYALVVRNIPSGTQTVAGTVTANIGTVGTLATAAKQDTGNTSLGTIDTSTAATATSLAVMDDWDESDRAKVNLIVGSAGVDGNSGNKSAATVRVVIATDQPQPTNAFKVDGSGVTQPVSGTVTTNPSASAVGGATTMNATSGDGSTALTSTAQVIKATAGTLYSVYIYNPNTTVAYVEFYNTAAGSVTVGTTNPLFLLVVPPLSPVAPVLGGAVGVAFSNAGWSWAATTTAGGNTAPTTALDAVAFYA